MTLHHQPVPSKNEPAPPGAWTVRFIFTGGSYDNKDDEDILITSANQALWDDEVEYTSDAGITVRAGWFAFPVVFAWTGDQSWWGDSLGRYAGVLDIDPATSAALWRVEVPAPGNYWASAVGGARFASGMTWEPEIDEVIQAPIANFTTVNNDYRYALDGTQYHAEPGRIAYYAAETTHVLSLGAANNSIGMLIRKISAPGQRPYISHLGFYDQAPA